MKAAKILVIDDEPIFLTTLGHALEQAGFIVCKAGDAKSARQFLLQNVPDVILLDLLLPNNGGEALLQDLKQDEKTKSIPVIVITNLADEDAKARCIALGCAEYLLKADYRLDQLIEKIKSVCVACLPPLP